VRQGWRRGSSGSVVGGRRGGGGELGGVGSTLCSVPWLWLSRLSLLLDSTRVDWTQTVDQDARRSGWLVFPREVARSLRRLSDPASQQRGGVLVQEGPWTDVDDVGDVGGRGKASRAREREADGAAQRREGKQQQQQQQLATSSFGGERRRKLSGVCRKGQRWAAHHTSTHCTRSFRIRPAPGLPGRETPTAEGPAQGRPLAHSLTRSLILRLPSKRRVACNWRGASQQLPPTTALASVCMPCPHLV
jgi:hypothetical protein